MSLMRQDSRIIWHDHLASAGETSPELDVSKVQFLTIYVEVDSPTTVTLQVFTCENFQDRDSITFSGAGHDWWEIWAQAWDKIRFKTSNACTITIEVKFKT